jgi:hypothetical protein
MVEKTLMAVVMVLLTLSVLAPSFLHFVLEPAVVFVLILSSVAPEQRPSCGSTANTVVGADTTVAAKSTTKTNAGIIFLIFCIIVSIPFTFIYVLFIAPLSPTINLQPQKPTTEQLGVL